MGPTVSVIIPVYKGGEAFRACLSSVLAAEPKPCEVIVVIDGDPDDSGRLAERRGARVLRLAERGGPARARNAGAQESRGELLLFIDADVTVPPDIIEQVTDAFEHEATLTALFGSYDDEPAQSNFLSQYKNLLHHYVHQTAREQASTFWGACGAIRREVFIELGGFNENYRRPCVEDIELGYRLKRAGHQIRLCKGLQVKHLKRWGIVSLLRSDFLDRAVPWSRLILRDGRIMNDLNVGRSGRASVMLVYLLLLSVAGSWWWHELLVLSGLLVLLLAAFNARIYRFFWRKRGVWFALGSFAWHSLYFAYSGLAFTIGVALHVLSGAEPVRPGQLAQGRVSTSSSRQAEPDP